MRSQRSDPGVRLWKLAAFLFVVLALMVDDVQSEFDRTKQRHFNEIEDVSLKYDFLGKQVFQVTLAAIMGGLIGFERRLAKSHKNLTYTVICTASCLVTLVSKQTPFIMGAMESKIDPTRIAASIVSGVGFLGAGFIIKGREKVNGMTSAAVIWASAALGMAIAFDYFIVATYTAFLLLSVLNLKNLVKLASFVISKATGKKPVIPLADSVRGSVSSSGYW
eukprot:TRINITY_DN13540_c0_g1_i1.p1 TRINITY_DN13540_c0_g1~~TRINITY_DN13540_c0_g1_i1.p1  ORF type:complete len:221 (-),score=48.53 TRINITY_DN13540_c0_g1_i1:67-729(-)